MSAETASHFGRRPKMVARRDQTVAGAVALCSDAVVRFCSPRARCGNMPVLTDVRNSNAVRPVSLQADGPNAPTRRSPSIAMGFAWGYRSGHRTFLHVG